MMHGFTETRQETFLSSSWKQRWTGLHLMYLCPQSRRTLWWNRSLVQMHALGFEAVNQMNTSDSSCHVVLDWKHPGTLFVLYEASCWQRPLMRSVDAPPHKEAGEQTRGNDAFWTKAAFSGGRGREMCDDSSLPSVVSSGTHNETISVCEAHVSQVSRMAQKAFVFGLKQIRMQVIHSGNVSQIAACRETCDSST